MPYMLVVRRYAPFKEFSGYEGDNRAGASTSLAASARCMGFVRFAQGRVMDWNAGSSGSTYMGLGSKVEHLIGRKYSDVRMTVSTVSASPQRVGFTLHNAGANPLAPPGAPPIDTFIEFSALFQPRQVAVSGTVRGDAFPNAEVFLDDGSNKQVLLFDFHTKFGPSAGPMLHLWGQHTGQVLGKFSVPIPTDGQGRFLSSVVAVPVTTGT